MDSVEPHDGTDHPDEHVDVDPAAGGDGPTTRRRRDERGASLVEYALLVALIAVVMVGAVTYLGDAAGDSLENSSSSVADATSS